MERYIMRIYTTFWPKSKILKWLGIRTKKYFFMELDDQATWAMDYTLAMIIVPMLKQLKETKQGAPLVDDEDVPDELKSTNALPGKDSDVDSNHFKRWDWILDEMIWAYKQDAMDDDWEEQYYTEKVDREVIDKHYKRMQNGHRLFGKYYNALWS